MSRWSDACAVGLRVPKSRAGRSRGMFVLVEDAAETITPADVESYDRGWMGDRLGHGCSGRVFEIPRWACGRCGDARTRAGRAAGGARSRSESGPAIRGGSLGSTFP